MSNPNLEDVDFKCGKVYYFYSNQLYNTKQPHYFILLLCDDDSCLVFMCLTKQFENRLKYIELKKYPLSTLVPIPKDNLNGLKYLESWVDCNKRFIHTKKEVLSMYKSNKLKVIGEVKLSQLEQIYQGVSESPEVEGFIKDKVFNLLKEANKQVG